MRKQNFIKTVLFCAPFALMACGGDNDNSSSYVNEDTPDSSSSTLDSNTSNYQDSSAIGNNFNSGMGNATVINGEIYDSKSRHTYKTIQFGAYVWMAENVISTRGICYNDKNYNCETYGSLFPSLGADACPDKFDIPYEDDFNYMLRFAGNIEDSKFGFNPQFSGSCVKKADYSCSGIDTTAYLITNDFTTLNLTSGKRPKIEDAASIGYYSLRCVRYSYFVESTSLLPTCDTLTYDRLDDFYVASSGTNYHCNGKKWVEAQNKECPKSSLGQKFYYKDSLFVCDGTWKLATMNDVDKECSEENKWEVLKINGQNYICEDDKWRKPTSIENELGLCLPDSTGNFKTLKEDSTLYYCDTTGWRKAILTDVAGICDSSKYYTETEFKNTQYVCRENDKWSTLDDTEEEIGVCSPKKLGKIDTLKSGKDLACDTAGWRTTVIEDYYGNCDSSKVYKAIDFKKAHYACRENNKWTSLTDTEEEIGVCSPKKLGTIDTLESGKDLACDTDGWRATVIEDYFGRCDSSKVYKIAEFKGTTYGCAHATKWEKLYHPETELGYCTPALKSTVKTDNSGKDYICDSVWRAATKTEALGECTAAKDGRTATYIKTRYVCANGTWRAVNAQDDTLGVCVADRLKDTGKIGSTTYICKVNGWATYTIIDAHDSCTDNRIDEVVEFQATKYVCRNNKWQTLTGIEAEHGICNSTTLGTKVTYKSDLYICDTDGWRKGTVTDILGECTSEKLNVIDSISSKYYRCDTSKKWVEYTDVERLYGLCNNKKHGKTVEVKGIQYGCSTNRRAYKWRSFVVRDENLGFCVGDSLKWGVDMGLDYSCGNSAFGWEHSTFWAMYTSCHNDDTFKFGVTVGFGGQHYFCHESLEDSGEGAGWHALTRLDSVGGICYKVNFGKTLNYDNKNYFCGQNNYSKYVWLPAKDINEYYGKCTDAIEGTKITFYGVKAECSENAWHRDLSDYNTITDERDGNVYKTIKIGSQEWMAENMRFKNDVSGIWCPEDYDCEKMGLLYDWYSAIDTVPAGSTTSNMAIKDSSTHQGICPDGWRIPVLKDFETLFKNREIINLRKTMTGYDDTHQDLYGFSFIDVGYQKFYSRVDGVYSGEFFTTNSKLWTMSQNKGNVQSIDFLTGTKVSLDKQYGYSVRCIRKN